MLQLYFDFISFSQFATISNEMKTGEVVFQVEFYTFSRTLSTRPLPVKCMHAFLVSLYKRTGCVVNAVDELHELLIQEKLGSDGELRTVRRDERIKDNALLPAAFIDTAGKMLYTKLLEGFEGEVFDAPPPCNSPLDFSSVSPHPQKCIRKN